MKKHLLGLALASISISSYAATTDIYKSADVKSDKVGTLDTNKNDYQPVFTKDNWTEVVNNNDGSIGWVENDKLKDTASAEVDIFSDINSQTDSLLKQHREMFKQMQSQMANFDKNMASLQTDTSKIMQTAKNAPNSKSFFKSVTMHTNDDGTATVVEKSKDSDGNTTEETKTIPTDKLNSIEI